MSLAKRIAYWVVLLIGSFVVALELVTVLATWLYPTMDTLARILVAALVGTALALLTWWLARDPVGRRTLKVDSPKFADFYAKWYSREGRIYVFCDDTDWLERDSARPIVTSLSNKGNRAHLFVRDATGSVVRELKESGVNVVPIPPSVNLKARLSLRLDDGKRDLIIRDWSQEEKTRRTDVNIFRETSDPYLVGLSQDLLAYIKGEQIQ